MKKTGMLILAAVLVMSVMAMPASAESTTLDSWSVRFTAEEKMVQDFGAGNTERTTNSLNRSLDDELRGMEPGDDITFTLSLKNEHKETTNWYMTNEVLDSLENQLASEAAHGGAYTYRLEYKGNREETLFNSETVGGDAVVTDREGLKEATGSLEDFFYLDTLKSGESGTVTLHVALDGETQGNDYQDTLADLEMNFAVELVPNDEPGPSPSTPPTNPPVVRTGDDYDLVPYYIAMMLSGVLFLVLAVDGARRRKKEASEK